MRKEVCRRLLGDTFSKGQVICEQGEVGDLFYIIVTGSVSVLVHGNEVAVLNAGAAFGELSLTGETEDERKRNASCAAGVHTRTPHRNLVSKGVSDRLLVFISDGRCNLGVDRSGHVPPAGGEQHELGV